MELAMELYIKLTDLEITQTITGMTLNPPSMLKEKLLLLKQRISSSNKNAVLITIEEFNLINKSIQICKNFNSR